MRTRRLCLIAATPPRRRGFSLLEVMLSLTLSIMLLSAIFSAMNQSWRLTASGREEMARSQLARALLRKISLDVRAVMFVPPPPSDGETDSTSTTTGTTASTGSSSTGASTTSPSVSTATSAASTTTDSTTEEEPSATSIGARFSRSL